MSARREGRIDCAHAVLDGRITQDVDTLDDASEAADLPAPELAAALGGPVPAALPAA